MISLLKELQRPKCEVEYLLPFNAEVKNSWSLVLVPVLLEGVVFRHRITFCIYNLLTAISVFICSLFNINDWMNWKYGTKLSWYIYRTIP